MICQLAKNIRPYCIAFAVVLNCTSPVAAQGLGHQDRAAIQELSLAFITAFQAGDMATVIGFLPPKVLANIASQNDMSPAKLSDTITQQSTQAMSGLMIEDFSMNFEDMNSGTTQAGRAYALVPTTTILSAGSQTTRTRTRTLFFYDEGEWFLLRIENADQVHFLTAVYKDFESIDFF